MAPGGAGRLIARQGRRSLTWWVSLSPSTVSRRGAGLAETRVLLQWPQAAQFGESHAPILLLAIEDGLAYAQLSDDVPHQRAGLLPPRSKAICSSVYLVFFMGLMLLSQGRTRSKIAGPLDRESERRSAPGLPDAGPSLSPRPGGRSPIAPARGNRSGFTVPEKNPANHRRNWLLPPRTGKSVPSRSVTQAAPPPQHLSSWRLLSRFASRLGMTSSPVTL